MDVRYITPKLKLGDWTFEIPESQRSPEITTGADIWIWVPEGIHTIQAIWKGEKGAPSDTKTLGLPESGGCFSLSPPDPAQSQS